MNSKKGKLEMKVLVTAILAIILLVIAFELYAVLVPTAQTAGDKLNVSTQCEDAGCYYNASVTLCESSAGSATLCASPHNTIPLAGLFASNGVVFVIVMAALLIIIVAAYLKFKKV